MGYIPARQWDTSRLPKASGKWDISLMPEDVDTPLVRTLKRLMHAKDGMSKKRLAEEAGVGLTYVRDVFEGRSKNPTASKLAKLAKVLGCSPAVLSVAASAESGEFVQDSTELLLLGTWRQLPKVMQQETLRFIRFHLADAEKSAGELDDV